MQFIGYNSYRRILIGQFIFNYTVYLFLEVTKRV